MEGMTDFQFKVFLQRLLTDLQEVQKEVNNEQLELIINDLKKSL